MRLFHASGTFPGMGSRDCVRLFHASGTFPGMGSLHCTPWLRFTTFDINDRHHAHGPPCPFPLKQFFCVSASCSRLQLTRWAFPGDDRIAVGPTDGPDGRAGDDGRTGRMDGAYWTDGQDGQYMDGPDGTVGPDGRTGAKNRRLGALAVA